MKNLITNTRAALNLDLFGIILMAVAIALGTWIGTILATAIGFAGGIAGAIIVGVIVYAVWALITGNKMRLWDALLFSILIYISGLVSAWITTAIGVQGGLIGLLFTAIVMTLAWGMIGGRKAKKTKPPIRF